MFKFVFGMYYNLLKSIFSAKIIKPVCVWFMSFLVPVFVMGIIIFTSTFLFSEINNENLKGCILATISIGGCMGAIMGSVMTVVYNERHN